MIKAEAVRKDGHSRDGLCPTGKWNGSVLAPSKTRSPVRSVLATSGDALCSYILASLFPQTWATFPDSVWPDRLEQDFNICAFFSHHSWTPKPQSAKTPLCVAMASNIAMASNLRAKASSFLLFQSGPSRVLPRRHPGTPKGIPEDPRVQLRVGDIADPAQGQQLVDEAPSSGPHTTNERGIRVKGKRLGGAHEIGAKSRDVSMRVD